MVIYDCNFVGVLTFPTKAKAPSIVDANAVPAAALAFEGFQAVAGRKAQDVESVDGIELEKLTAGSALNVRRQVTRREAGKELFGLGVGEAFNHGTQLWRSGTDRKLNSYAERNSARSRSVL
jgi:hypothetical protein